MNDEFLPIDDAAKELGVTAGRIRSRLADGHYTAFVRVADEHAEASQKRFLPAWESEDFPHNYWTDSGTDMWASKRRIAYDGFTGWVALDSDAVAKLLLNVEATLYGKWVWVPGRLDSNPETWVPIQLIDTRYEPQDRGPLIRESSLYLSVSSARRSDGIVAALDKSVTVKERNNLLRIIDALAVMNDLSDRGAVAAVEKQLEVLGYDGPKDDTIRGVLSYARKLRPKAKTRAV